MAPSDSIDNDTRPTSEVAEGFARDDATLARLGKKAILKRNFSFCLSWVSTVLCSYLDTEDSGGPSGILYGFIVVRIGTLSVFATLSEMAYMAPTSGGQYHWVSMMAPPTYRKFLSFITGWLTLTGWQASTASGAYLTGTAVQGLIILTHPEYLNTIQNWHGTLLFWAVLLLGYAINTALSSLLARFEGLVLVFRILGFFAVIFPLVFLSKHSTSQAVWNIWLNLGDWPAQGSFAPFFGFSANEQLAIQMSEEVRNPAVTVPWSLMIGLCINGTLGFAMLVATLYRMGDIDTRLEENPIYPFMAIFSKALGSTAGAAVLSSLFRFLFFFHRRTCNYNTRLSNILISHKMCTSKYMKYTCNCKKEMEFIQCPERRGTNVKCSPIIKEWGKDSDNYCAKHLVNPSAPVKYTDQLGRVVEE